MDMCHKHVDMKSDLMTQGYTVLPGYHELVDILVDMNIGHVDNDDDDVYWH